MVVTIMPCNLMPKFLKILSCISMHHHPLVKMLDLLKGFSPLIELVMVFDNIQIHSFISCILCIHFYKYDHKGMLSWFKII